MIPVLVLAAGEQTPEDVGKSPPLAALITVLLLIAAILLVRSMGRHLKKVPASFEPQDDELGQVVVPDTPEELLRRRPEPGEELLDRLRRAPRAIEPPRPPDRPAGEEPGDHPPARG